MPEPSLLADRDVALATHAIVRLDTVHYAVPIDRVIRASPPPRCTRLPGTPPHVRGVFSLAGRIITAWDLRLLFATDPAADAQMLVVEHAGKAAGLVVDEVAVVAPFDTDTDPPFMDPPPETIAPIVTGTVQTPASTEGAPAPGVGHAHLIDLARLYARAVGREVIE